MWRNIWACFVVVLSLVSICVGYIYGDVFFQLGNASILGNIAMKCVAGFLSFIFSASVLALIEQFLWD